MLQASLFLLVLLKPPFEKKWVGIEEGHVAYLNPDWLFPKALRRSLAVSLALLAFVNAQDGGPPTGDTTGKHTYSCDATKCKLPNCACASTSPPGGLSPVRNSNHRELMD